MKTILNKLILVSICLQLFNVALAQDTINKKKTPVVKAINSEPITIVKHKYYYQGERLKRNNDIGKVLKVNASPDIYHDFKVGKNMGTIGTVIAEIGFVSYIVGYYTRLGSPATAVSLMTFGIPVFFVGATLSIIGNSMVKKSIKKYNSSFGVSYKPQLYFGISPNAVSLSLRF